MAKANNKITVTAKVNIDRNGTLYAPGESLDLPADDAKQLIDVGAVVAPNAESSADAAVTE